MSHVPQVSGGRVVRPLQKAGFVLLRQSGGHAILRHQIDLNRRAVVPVHGSKTVKPGTLRAILRGAQIGIDEFRELIA